MRAQRAEQCQNQRRRREQGVKRRIGRANDHRQQRRNPPDDKTDGGGGGGLERIGGVVFGDAQFIAGMGIECIVVCQRLCHGFGKRRVQPALAVNLCKFVQFAFGVMPERMAFAREICRFQECTTAAAKRRIRALEARGHKIETVRKRLGARGPLSVGYTIADAL